MPKQSNPNEPVETREQKRLRKLRDAQAKVSAKRVVYPLVGLLIALIVGLFVYRYGAGGVTKSSRLQTESFNLNDPEFLKSMDPELLKKLQDAMQDGADINLDAEPEADDN